MNSFQCWASYFAEVYFLCSGTKGTEELTFTAVSIKQNNPLKAFAMVLIHSQGPLHISYLVCVCLCICTWVGEHAYVIMCVVFGRVFQESVLYFFCGFQGQTLAIRLALQTHLPAEPSHWHNFCRLSLSFSVRAKGQEKRLWRRAWDIYFCPQASFPQNRPLVPWASWASDPVKVGGSFTSSIWTKRVCDAVASELSLANIVKE